MNRCILDESKRQAERLHALYDQVARAEALLDELLAAHGGILDALYDRLGSEGFSPAAIRSLDDASLALLIGPFTVEVLRRQLAAAVEARRLETARN